MIYMYSRCGQPNILQATQGCFQQISRHTTKMSIASSQGVQSSIWILSESQLCKYIYIHIAKGKSFISPSLPANVTSPSLLASLRKAAAVVQFTTKENSKSASTRFNSSAAGTNTYMASQDITMNAATQPAGVRQTASRQGFKPEFEWRVILCLCTGNVI